MRVSHVITRLIVGGAQENTISTVLGLSRLPGLQVELISGPSIGPEGSLESLVAHPPGLLRVLPSLVRPIHPFLDLLALRDLTRHFRQTRPDIVHTHSGKAGVLGRLAAARAGIKIIVHTIHGPSFGPFQGRFSNFIFRAAERHAARVTTHFITVAQAMTRQYLQAGIGRPDQYTRIFSGFDLRPFASAQNDPALRASYGIEPSDLVIGTIGRLFKLKGHDELFAIAPKIIEAVPRVKFLLVGDGPWRSRFEALAASGVGKNHFVFTGLVPPSEVPRHVGIMDFLVHLSRREGLPRALPQALAAGRPVVATDCDGAGEVCLDGQTGFLIAPDDSSRLEEKILALAGNPDLRRRLGAAGRSFVLENFPVESMVSRIHQLYLQLLAVPATSVP